MSNSYPVFLSLNDGTKVEVNTVLDGAAFIFNLEKPESDPESFVWAPPGSSQAENNYESALSANEMEALRAFLKMQQ